MWESLAVGMGAAASFVVAQGFGLEPQQTDEHAIACLQSSFATEFVIRGIQLYLHVSGPYYVQSFELQTAPPATPNQGKCHGVGASFAATSRETKLPFFLLALSEARASQYAASRAKAIHDQLCGSPWLYGGSPGSELRQMLDCARLWTPLREEPNGPWNRQGLAACL